MEPIPTTAADQILGSWMTHLGLCDPYSNKLGYLLQSRSCHAMHFQDALIQPRDRSLP